MRLDPKHLNRLRGSLVQSAAEREAALDPKKRFGRYVLVREVGRGGSGAVYQAFEEGLDRAVALKFLHTDDEKAVQRFVREARTAARLAHPSIVPIYEVGEHDGRHFIAMEFIEGQTLGERRWEPRVAAEIMAAVADAVQFAHDQGVIHRDLKPQNLIRGADGRVRVMDFGLAREVKPGTTLTLTGSVIGTPSYMSPEQAEGRRCDERSDVYSLGATLYELLAGRPPFEGETLVEILDRVRHDDPRPPRRIDARVPLELETIAMKAMEKDPSRRYASARALAEDLGRWLKGEPIAAQPISFASRIWRRGVKHRAVVLPVVIGIVVSVALGAWAWKSSAASRAKDESYVLQRQGVDAMDLGRFDEAIELFTRAVTVNPALATGYYNRARVRQAKGEPKQSLADLRKAVEIDPKMSLAWAAGAWLKLNLGDAEGAISDYDQAIACESGQWRYWMNRGRAKSVKGDAAGAMADADHAIGMDPKAALPQVLRGQLLEGLSRPDEAMRAFDAALAADPRCVDALEARALLLGRQQRPKESLRDLDEALKLTPRSESLLYNRGVVRSKLRDFAGAASDFELALTFAPRDWPNWTRCERALKEARANQKEF